MTDLILRYIRYSDIEAYAECGWRPIASWEGPSGAYALVQWMGETEPQEIVQPGVPNE